MFDVVLDPKYQRHMLNYAALVLKIQGFSAWYGRETLIEQIRSHILSAPFVVERYRHHYLFRTTNFDYGTIVKRVQDTRRIAHES